MQSIRPVLRLHMWLETDDGLVFGFGRAKLLQNVAEYGSLKRAAEAMGMSYRAAWGKIKQSEAVLGSRLIRKAGSNRSGYELTPFGKGITQKFMSWFDKVEKNALEEAAATFPWMSEPYQDQCVPEESTEDSCSEDRFSEKKVGANNASDPLCSQREVSF